MEKFIEVAGTGKRRFTINLRHIVSFAPIEPIDAESSEGLQTMIETINDGFYKVMDSYDEIKHCINQFK